MASAKMASAKKASAGKARERSSDRRPEGPRFFNELYWFAVIGLSAWIIGALVLPPRLVRTQELLLRETELVHDLCGKRLQERGLHSAIEATENDPFYREGVFREVLRVRRKTEKYFEPPPPSFPITPLDTDIEFVEEGTSVRNGWRPAH